MFAVLEEADFTITFLDTIVKKFSLIFYIKYLM